MTTIKPNFEQVYIGGAYLPPNSSIKDVMAKIGKGKVKLTPDEIASAKQLFCELSNEYTDILDKKLNPVKHLLLGNNDKKTIELMGLDNEWLIMLKVQSDRLGRNYHQLIQYLFVIEWYCFLLGDTGVINTPKLGEEISKLLNVWYGKKPHDKYSPSWNLKGYKPHLGEFEDFSIAREVFDDYYSLLTENIGYGFVRVRTPEIDMGISHLRYLQIAMDEIVLEKIRLSSTLQMKNKVLGFCTNCMTNYLYDRRTYKVGNKTSSICPRPKCRGGYIKTLNSRLRQLCTVCGKRRLLIDGKCSKCK